MWELEKSAEILPSLYYKEVLEIGQEKEIDCSIDSLHSKITCQLVMDCDFLEYSETRVESVISANLCSWRNRKVAHAD